eukprot:m51a1_g7927 hypothetical protein (144) ;mRNA; f:42851-43396
MPEEKDLGIAYLLWVVGGFGIWGIQRCYIGDIGLGVAYFFTGGLFGIGSTLDLCLLPSAVARANRKDKAAVAVAPAPAGPIVIQMTNNTVQQQVAPPPQPLFQPVMAMPAVPVVPAVPAYPVVPTAPPAYPAYPAYPVPGAVS